MSTFKSLMLMLSAIFLSQHIYSFSSFEFNYDPNPNFYSFKICRTINPLLFIPLIYELIICSFSMFSLGNSISEHYLLLVDVVSELFGIFLTIEEYSLDCLFWSFPIIILFPLSEYGNFYVRPEALNGGCCFVVKSKEDPGCWLWGLEWY